MNNRYIAFGLTLGLWVAINQLIDKLVTNVGHIEFSTLWAIVVAFLLVGTVIAIYEKVKG